MAQLALTLYILAVLIGVFLFDALYRIIPLCHVVALAAIGAIALLQIDIREALVRLTGAFFTMAALALVRWSYARLRRRAGLGWGDVKLVGAGALWVDPIYLGPWLLLATLSAFASLAFLRWQGVTITRETSIPFGPHLACGLWIVWLAQISQF